MKMKMFSLSFVSNKSVPRKQASAKIEEDKKRVNHKQRITLPALDSTVHKTHQTLYVRFTFQNHSGIIHRGFCKLVLGGFSDFHKNLNCRLHPLVRKMATRKYVLGTFSNQQH